jgi:hypothetical protein
MMDLRCKLQTFFLQNLKQIRDSKKTIECFIEILKQIEKIINQDIIINLHSTCLIKSEFLTNFYSQILYEILFNFNHPDLFQQQNVKLNEFKSLFTNIMVQTNYQDTFQVLFKLCCNLK